MLGFFLMMGGLLPVVIHSITVGGLAGLNCGRCKEGVMKQDWGTHRHGIYRLTLNVQSLTYLLALHDF